MKPIGIEIHPGHWKNPGSGASGILNEVTEARKVAKRVYDILRSGGVPVSYFEDNTSTNQKQNLNTLVKYHNQDVNDLVVSIHFNAGGDSNRPIGTEVLYYDQKTLAEKLAKAISDATGGGLLNRGAKQRKDLAVLSRTYEPAVLIEVCFVNSSVDAAIYRRDFEKICQAIAECLAEYVGKPLKKKVTNVPNVQEQTKEADEIMLTETARNEARELIRKACKKGIFNAQYHTEERIKNYTDAQLISYAIIYLNRTAG